MENTDVNIEEHGGGNRRSSDYKFVSTRTLSKDVE